MVESESAVVVVTGTSVGAIEAGWHHDSRVKANKVAAKRNDDSMNKGYLLLTRDCCLDKRW